MAKAFTFCPFCGQKMNIRVESIGTVRRCQACGEKFVPELRQQGCLARLVRTVLTLVVITIVCAVVLVWLSQRKGWAMKVWMLAVVCASLVVGCDAGAPEEPEPTYKGRTLTEWRAMLHDVDDATQAEAVGAVGMMAVSSERARATLRESLPKLGGHARALALTLLLGKDEHQAEYARELESLLDHPNDDTRRRAALAFAVFGGQKEMRVALPTLEKVAQSDSSAEVRRIAGDGVAKIKAAATQPAS